MFYLDHRMVSGSPPYSYYPSSLYPPGFEQYAGYFPKYYTLMEPSSTDLITMPPSPNSIQSDSDNSLSSVEVSVKSRKSELSPGGEVVRCCWRSCGLNFDSLNQLANHVTRVHAASGPDGLFYCGWDGCTRNNKGFNARYKMLVHVRTHTNEKPHQCPQCAKSFSRAENLKIHSRSHSGEKPYVCHVAGCNKAYSNSSDRFKHLRTHQVEKPYQCKVQGCMKRYTDPSSLRKHVKTYKHSADDGKIPQNGFEAVAAHPRQSPPDEKLCDYACCQKQQESSMVIRVGALINFRKEETYWNHFMEPDFTPKQNIYNFSCSEPHNIDVDMPLDLSISRH